MDPLGRGCSAGLSTAAYCPSATFHPVEASARARLGHVHMDGFGGRRRWAHRNTGGALQLDEEVAHKVQRDLGIPWARAVAADGKSSHADGLGERSEAADSVTSKGRVFDLNVTHSAVP